MTGGYCLPTKRFEKESRAAKRLCHWPPNKVVARGTRPVQLKVHGSDCSPPSAPVVLGFSAVQPSRAVAFTGKGACEWTCAVQSLVVRRPSVYCSNVRPARPLCPPSQLSGFVLRDFLRNLGHYCPGVSSPLQVEAERYWLASSAGVVTRALRRSAVVEWALSVGLDAVGLGG